MRQSKIKVLLIDDDQGSRLALERISMDDGIAVELVGKCSSADEAIEQIQVLRPELLLLDIQLRGKNGFEVLKAFDHPTFKVIIISDNDQYAMDAIKYAVEDYVLKPFDHEVLKKSIRKVINEIAILGERQLKLDAIINKYQAPSNKLIIPTNKGFHTICFDQIESILAQSGNYCLFKLMNKSCDIVTKPLTFLEKMLPNNQFFRIHRAVMINLFMVKVFDRKRSIVKMENGDEFKVAARRKRNFILRAKMCISRG